MDTKKVSENFKKQLDELLILGVQKGATDVHLSPGYYPTIRIDGVLVPLTDYKVLDRHLLEGLIYALLGTEDLQKRFLTDKEVDLSYQPSQNIRFRVNVYHTRGNYAASLRFIPDEIKNLRDLNLPPKLDIFTRLSQGFVLIVGPTGHGKSTTLAAIINMINQQRAEKIITIEDPIEYIFVPEKSIIDQREVGPDTNSFARALRASFRENVNVIMVGEMRDHETMSAAVTAAETGHLVLASLHTNDAAQTVERIIDSFPADQQAQITSQLANTISGIISQRLIPRAKGGLVPAIELLIANAAVRNIVREGQVEQLNLVIGTSSEEGMISMNQSLAGLVRKNEITLEQAQFYTPNMAELKSLLK